MIKTKSNTTDCKYNNCIQNNLNKHLIDKNLINKNKINVLYRIELNLNNYHSNSNIFYTNQYCLLKSRKRLPSHFSIHTFISTEKTSRFLCPLRLRLKRAGLILYGSK